MNSGGPKKTATSLLSTAATGALAIQNMQADRQKSSESGQMNNSLMSQSNNTSAAPPSQATLNSTKAQVIKEAPMTTTTLAAPPTVGCLKTPATTPALTNNDTSAIVPTSAQNGPKPTGNSVNGLSQHEASSPGVTTAAMSSSKANSSNA